MKRKILSLALVVSWMALIFYLSHQPATQSNGISTGVTEKVIEIIEKIAPNLDIDIRSFNHIIRKNAHFYSYLILGILVSNVVSNYQPVRKKGFILALSICVLYAISDEVHQLFIPGRSGQIKDVFIDSVGAVVGVLGYIGFEAKIIRTGG